MRAAGLMTLDGHGASRIAADLSAALWPNGAPLNRCKPRCDLAFGFRETRHANRLRAQAACTKPMARTGRDPRRNSSSSGRKARYRSVYPRLPRAMKLRWGRGRRNRAQTSARRHDPVPVSDRFPAARKSLRPLRDCSASISFVACASLLHAQRSLAVQACNEIAAHSSSGAYCRLRNPPVLPLRQQMPM